MIDKVIHEDWARYGVRFKEEADHTVKVYQGEHFLGAYLQDGLDVQNLLIEIEAGKYAN